ncbi:MAG TPA: molybdenum cofactor biosynthesis protein MoaE [Chthoniobacterales bacterium]|jgi:molybdopterin synthase catalytic subunit
MEISVELCTDRIEDRWVAPPAGDGSGAVVEFRGVVRGAENGRPISALRYEAYETMAVSEMKRLLAEEGRNCVRAVAWHRHGWIPVGDTAILVWIEGRHRGEAFALLTAFMDRLKVDVPIWKVEAAP